LRNIFSELHTIISQYQPDEMSIEQVFVHRNADSALKLGQARSAAICATFSSKIPVFEYAARAVKQAIVGRGGADKEQVQHMVKILLQYEGEMGLDESDALGIALCHAHSRLLVHGLSFPEQSAGGVSR
jgi:crossover junction endodeoxyribonuclease RuvC